MDFKTYVNSLPKGGKSQLAKALGVSPSYLSRMLAGLRPITPSRALDIEKATAGAVTRRDLRPNDWFHHWPELATQGTKSGRTLVA